MMEDLPLEIAVDIAAPQTSHEWHRGAAATLNEHGACVLKSANKTPLIAPDIVERCLCDARPRLDRLHEVATRYRESGAAVGKTVPGALQFMELVSRHPRECRYDVTCINERLKIGGARAEESSAPLPDSDDAAWVALLAAVDALVQPVLRRQAEDTGSAHAAFHAEAVGFVLSLPGAPLQQWHPDDAYRVGLYNVFVPLVDLSEDNGATEFALGTHTEGMQLVARRALARDYSPQPRNPGTLTVVRPLLEAGRLLLFDWRTWHRGGANQSTHDRPVAQITYAGTGLVAYSYKDDLPSLTTWASANVDAAGEAAVSPLPITGPIAGGGAHVTAAAQTDGSVHAADVCTSGSVWGRARSSAAAYLAMLAAGAACGGATFTRRGAITSRGLPLPRGGADWLLAGAFAAIVISSACALRRCRLNTPRQESGANVDGDQRANASQAPPLSTRPEGVPSAPEEVSRAPEGMSRAHPPFVPADPTAAPSTPLRTDDVVRLSDGSFATLASFDTSDSTWGMGGSTRRAREAECAFAYRWRLSALSELRTAKEAPEVCDGPSYPHRTLRTQSAFAEGEVMFIEFPCLVYTNTPTAYASCAARWQACCELSERARREPECALLKQVLGDMTFDAVSAGANAVRVLDGARAVARTQGASATSGASGALIGRACLRLESNAVPSDARGHWMAEGAGFCALYAYTALLNHSCDPSADIGPGRTSEARLHTRALVDLAVGEEITINYGPVELPSWPVARRREYLLAHHSFVCACCCASAKVWPQVLSEMKRRQSRVSANTILQATKDVRER